MKGLFVALLLALGIASPAHAQTSDALAWAKAKTCADYRAFASAYPSSGYAAQARTKIAETCGAGTAARPAQAAAVTFATCQQLSEQWDNKVVGSSLKVMKAFLSTVPAQCAVLKASAQEEFEKAREQEDKKNAIAEKMTLLAARYVGAFSCTVSWAEPGKTSVLSQPTILSGSINYETSIRLEGSASFSFPGSTRTYDAGISATFGIDAFNDQQKARQQNGNAWTELMPVGEDGFKLTNHHSMNLDCKRT